MYDVTNFAFPLFWCQAYSRRASNVLCAAFPRFVYEYPYQIYNSISLKLCTSYCIAKVSEKCMKRSQVSHFCCNEISGFVWDVRERFESTHCMSSSVQINLFLYKNSSNWTVPGHTSTRNTSVDRRDFYWVERFFRKGCAVYELVQANPGRGISLLAEAVPILLIEKGQEINP